MLSSARIHAEHVLLSQVYFQLDGADWKALNRQRWSRHPRLTMVLAVRQRRWSEPVGGERKWLLTPERQAENAVRTLIAASVPQFLASEVCAACFRHADCVTRLLPCRGKLAVGYFSLEMRTSHTFRRRRQSRRNSPIRFRQLWLARLGGRRNREGRRWVQICSLTPPGRASGGRRPGEAETAVGASAQSPIAAAFYDRVRIQAAAGRDDRHVYSFDDAGAIAPLAFADREHLGCKDHPRT